MEIAVLGAGSWGSALANLLGAKGYSVRLWARRAQVAQSINDAHVNPRYLSDATLSPNIEATCDLAAAIKGAQAIVIVTPSSAIRQTANNLRDITSNETPIIICSKGIETETGMLSSDVLAEVLGNPLRLAVLSGPNHAEEVIKNIPAGSVIASPSAQTARTFQEMFATDNFRTYTSTDITGVQLCAAYKNVIAIAVGMSYGAGLGDNTASLLITRGIAEMNRLICAAGGCAQTALGLAGVGDMIATCMSKHSRNRTFGESFAAGETLDSYTQRTHMVVEGARACRALCELSKKHNVELPINEAVNKILWHGGSIETGKKLLLRPLKDELD